MYSTAIGGLMLRPPPMPGRVSMTLTETHSGEPAMAGVFQCVPQSSENARLGERHRIVVQVRVLRGQSTEDPRSIDYERLVALCAFGDPPGPQLTWVQTGHFLPERIEYFGGHTEDRGTLQRHPPPSFAERGEPWWVDSESDFTARYGGVGLSLRPIGHSDGEIIYDVPEMQLAYVNLFHDWPNIRRLESPIQFRAYLYHRPGGYDTISRQDPLVMVEWWHTQAFTRDQPGARMRVTGDDPRIMWIIPDPIEPVDLDQSIRQRYLWR